MGHLDGELVRTCLYNVTGGVTRDLFMAFVHFQGERGGGTLEHRNHRSR